MSLTTTKYVLKADRTKSIEVQSPVFSFASIVEDGKVVREIPRHELDASYEPELQKARPTKFTEAAASNSKLDQRLANIETVLGRIERVLISPATKPVEGEKAEQTS